jgi:hypothetical protein
MLALGTVGNRKPPPAPRGFLGRVAASPRALPPSRVAELAPGPARPHTREAEGRHRILGGCRQRALSASDAFAEEPLTDDEVAFRAVSSSDELRHPSAGRTAMLGRRPHARTPTSDRPTGLASYTSPARWRNREIGGPSDMFDASPPRGRSDLGIGGSPASPNF